MKDCFGLTTTNFPDFETPEINKFSITELVQYYGELPIIVSKKMPPGMVMVVDHENHIHVITNITAAEKKRDESMAELRAALGEILRLRTELAKLRGEAQA